MFRNSVFGKAKILVIFLDGCNFSVKLKLGYVRCCLVVYIMFLIFGYDFWENRFKRLYVLFGFIFGVYVCIILFVVLGLWW